MVVYFYTILLLRKLYESLVWNSFEKKIIYATCLWLETKDLNYKRFRRLSLILGFAKIGNQTQRWSVINCDDTKILGLLPKLKRFLDRNGHEINCKWLSIIQFPPISPIKFEQSSQLSISKISRGYVTVQKHIFNLKTNSYIILVNFEAKFLLKFSNKSNHLSQSNMESKNLVNRFLKWLHSDCSAFPGDVS